MSHAEVEIPSKRYWEEKFVEFDFDFIVKHLFLPNAMPRKCQIFNWRIFNGQINTEARLLRMRLSNGTCTLCTLELENVQHLLISCTCVEKVWIGIENMISKIRQNYTLLSNFNKIFGFKDIDTEMEFCNTLLSITRWNIWKRRCIFRYENKYMSQDELLTWILDDYKQNLQILRTGVLFKNKALIEEIQRRIE